MKINNPYTGTNKGAQPKKGWAKPSVGNQRLTTISGTKSVPAFNSLLINNLQPLNKN